MCIDTRLRDPCLVAHALEGEESKRSKRPSAVDEVGKMRESRKLEPRDLWGVPENVVEYLRILYILWEGGRTDRERGGATSPAVPCRRTITQPRQKVACDQQIIIVGAEDLVSSCT